MTTLPERDTPVALMVAPNGARRGKADHPALPVTIAETVAEAVASAAAGASILHAHVRDSAGRHVIDAGLYRELLTEMERSLPGFPVQVTTESAGIFTPDQQAALLADLRPAFASVALRELAQDEDLASRTYHRAQEQGTSIQHILYDSSDLARFKQLRCGGVIPPGPAALIMVLGRYATNGIATPQELAPFLDEGIEPLDRWWLCAFGPAEGDCAAEAIARGGHPRIGFENNLHRRDGVLAPGNAALIGETVQTVIAMGKRPAKPNEARRLLQTT